MQDTNQTLQSSSLQWKELVGQEVAKRNLDFHYTAFLAGEPLPHTILCAPRGFGKTTFADAFAYRVLEAKKERRYFDTNCANFKTFKQFWDNLIMPVVHDKDVVVLLDEVSELTPSITMNLLTMLNPNRNNRNEFEYDGVRISIDFFRQTFIFATTEPHKVFHALMDRLLRVDLSEYSHQDLATILQRNCRGVMLASGVADYIAPVLRGNARQAVRMADNIRKYLRPLKRTTFAMDDWRKLSTLLGILPLGVNPLELQVLKVLQGRTDTPLTRIASVLKMTPVSVQKDLELYLQAKGLIEITTKGRNLTSMGYQYLQQLEAETKTAKKK